MQAELDGHAPETEEIFPPPRPAHDHQKGAQIMEKIHPPKLVGAAERRCVILIFFFNPALTVFEIAPAPFQIQSGDKTGDKLCLGTVSSIWGLSLETGDVWSP